MNSELYKTLNINKRVGKRKKRHIKIQKSCTRFFWGLDNKYEKAAANQWSFVYVGIYKHALNRAHTLYLTPTIQKRTTDTLISSTRACTNCAPALCVCVYMVEFDGGDNVN